MNRVVTLFFLLCLIATADAQVRVQVKVTDHITSEPVPGAHLHIEPGHTDYVTNGKGIALLAVRPGKTHIHVDAVGYQNSQVKLDLYRDTTISIILKTEEETVELQTFTIRASSSDLDSFGPDIASEQVVSLTDHTKSGADNLIETLATKPGIKTLQTGVGINKPIIQGLTGSRVSIVEDGVAQEEQQWGGDHGAAIAGNTMDKLTIYSGSATLMFGGSSNAGVIQFETADLLNRAPKGQRYYSDFQTRYRSVNNGFDYSLRYARELDSAKALRIQFFSEGSGFGDYKVPASSFNYLGYVIPIHDKTLINTAGKRFTDRVTLSWKGKNATHLIYASVFHQKIGFFPGTIGSPISYTLDPTRSSRDVQVPYQVNQHRKFLYKRVSRVRNTNVRFEAGLQHNIRKEISAGHAHGRPADATDSLALQLDLITANTNLRFSTPVKHGDLKYGLQGMFQYNGIKGFEYLIPSYRLGSLGGYLTREHKLKHYWKADYGLRLEAMTRSLDKISLPFYQSGDLIGIAVRNEAADQFRTGIAAKGGIRYNHSHWDVSLHVARTYRFLNIAEIASNGMHHGAFRYEQGNINNKPENGIQNILDVKWNNTKWNWRSSVFFNHFFNFIYLTPSGRFATVTVDGEVYASPEPGQVYEYREAPVRHFGGDFELKYKPTLHWRFGVGGDFVWSQNMKTYIPVAFTPPPSVQTTAEYLFHNSSAISTVRYFAAGVVWNKVFAQNRVAINEKTTPGYDVLRAHVRLNLKKDWTVALVGNNLMNKYYLKNTSRYRLVNLPEPGRNIVLSVSHVL